MKGIQGTSNKTYRQLLGNGIRHEIPKFQRDYSWKAQQWDDLWQDIQALYKDEENEYYMGYLVLQTHNNKEFQIIDGQQRLTTMSLFILAILKALNGLIKADIDPECRRVLGGVFFRGNQKSRLPIRQPHLVREKTEPRGSSNALFR